MIKANILLVDDDIEILDFLQYNLQNNGYKVYTTNNGNDAIELVKKISFDLIILDLMLPIMDGIEICRIIRNENLISQPLIIFLTSRNEDYSQIEGFKAGADDYISKPIKPRLLTSKIEAILRRKKLIKKTNDYKYIKIDRNKFYVEIENKILNLPKKEFELLDLLMKKPGKVFTRDEIFFEIWNEDTLVGERTIDVHIRKLREKFGDKVIKTVKGIGYSFCYEDF